MALKKEGLFCCYRVLYNTSMSFVSHRRVLPALLFLFCLLVSACSYHGRLRRGIYKAPSFSDKIEARVLVVSDHFIQQDFSFKDDNLSPVNEYSFATSDGVAVAAADALGTLFSHVDAGPKHLSSQYDLIAEVDYQLEDKQHFYSNKVEEHNGFLWIRPLYIPSFSTHITLTLRQPHNKIALLSFSAKRQSNLTYNDLAVGLHWFNKLTFSLFFPVVAPAYVQASGVSARSILEKDLRSAMEEIMGKVEENRIIFTPEGTPFLPRQDNPYKEYLQKTVYLEFPDGHGTGFFISPDGYLLTNAHVVEEYRDARFYLYEDLPFLPKRPEPPFRYARVIKVNKTRDLALLKAEGNFPYFELESDRSFYQTGATILTLGNPQDKMWTMTQGIISALNNYNGTDEIQIDSPVNAGNSGGPLVLKSTGKVIGVVSRTINPSMGSGMGYAISAFEVLRTLDINPNLNLFQTENPPQQEPPLMKETAK